MRAWRRIYPYIIQASDIACAGAIAALPGFVSPIQIGRGVMDPIKELLQINIDDYPVAVLHITLRLKHSIMRSSARPEAIAVFRECRINTRLQTLQQGLLDQPIRQRRYPEFPHIPALPDWPAPVSRLALRSLLRAPA